MIVRSARPVDLEMPLSGFADFITPLEHFFVRTHVYAPAVTLADWRLRVEGAVSNPLALSMEELKRFPATELVGVLECAGNGRAFYEPPVAGIQWRHGAVGNGRWRGARLADVLKKAGVNPAATEVVFDGADVPLGTMPDFQRSVPLKKALDPATLLAWDMNGEALPTQHGFPLRAVIPGWAGDCWVKWITGIRVVNAEFDGFWMRSAYRYPERLAAPGAAVAPEATRAVTSLRIKSVIAAPENGAVVQVGKPLVISGTAWSGDTGPVAAVEISVDNGRAWKSTRLGGQSTRFGWRLWDFSWTPSSPGYQTVLARARDAAGNVQPMSQEWNPSGYLWNVVPRIALDVRDRVEPVPGSSSLAPSEPMPAEVRRVCGSCHEDDLIRQQRLTPAQWGRELDKMANWGAPVTSDNRASILEYLSRLGRVE
jgi:sulfite oxidase